MTSADFLREAADRLDKWIGGSWFGQPQIARAVADWLRDESHALLTGRISEPTAHAVAVAAAVLGRPAPTNDAVKE